MFIFDYKKVNLYCLPMSHKKWANSTDQNKTPQNVASDQGLHCLLTEYSK